MFAAHKQLDNLVIIVDCNGLQIDGSTAQVGSVEPLDTKFESFGFNVINIDGHDFDDIESALDNAKACKGKPTAIIAKTIKGKGVSFMENQVGWHGKATNAEEFEIAIGELDAQIKELEG